MELDDFGSGIAELKEKKVTFVMEPVEFQSCFMAKILDSEATRFLFTNASWRSKLERAFLSRLLLRIRRLLRRLFRGGELPLSGVRWRRHLRTPPSLLLIRVDGP